MNKQGVVNLYTCLFYPELLLHFCKTLLRKKQLLFFNNNLVEFRLAAGLPVLCEFSHKEKFKHLDVYQSQCFLFFYCHHERLKRFKWSELS